MENFSSKSMGIFDMFCTLEGDDTMDYKLQERNLNEDTQKITKGLIDTNKLKTLIDIKKLVKKLPTSCEDDVLERRRFVKIIEKYDNGFVSTDRKVIIVIRSIINEFRKIKYRDKDLLSYIFEDYKYAINVFC